MPTKRGWKQKMIEAGTLRGKSMVLIYRRVKLLVEVFEDDDFLAQNDGMDEFEAAAILDAELKDVASSFLMLRRILQEFPNLSSWEERGDLRKMIATVRELDKRGSQQEKPAPRRATLQQLEELTAEKEVLETRLDAEEKRSATATDEMARLRQDNATLREEIAKAHGRIEELERVLNRELAASGA